MTHAVALTFAGTGAQVVLTAIFGILSARLLGPGGKGQLSTMLIGAGMLGLLVELGLRTVITRQVAAGRATWQESVATAATMYAALCAVLLPVVGYLLLTFHDDFYQLRGIPPKALLLALIGVPLGLLEGALTGAINGYQRTPETAALLALEKLVVILGFVLAVPVLHGGLIGAMVAQVAGTALGIATGLMLLARLPGGRLRLRPDLVPEFLKFGPMCYSANLATALNFRLDALLVFALLGKVPAGVYAVAVSLAEFPLYLPNSIASVLLPTVSAEPGDRRVRTARITRLTAFTILVACLGLALGGRPLLGGVFGSGFLPGYGPLLLLLPGMVVLGVNKVLAAELLGRGHAAPAVASAWTALGATVVLDLLLIPRWGILGAAAASTVAYTISGVVLLARYRQLTGMGFWRLYAARPHEVAAAWRRLAALPGRALARRAPR